MGLPRINEIMKGAMKVAYKSELEYCRRVVETVNAVTQRKNCLLDKEVSIVVVMCKMSLEGKDYRKSREFICEMEVCGVEPIGMGTLRNYRSKIGKKGWFEGKGFNLLMKKAISQGGIGLGIFLSNGRQEGS